MNPGVADINLYAEFAITMSGPALGLLFIYLGYRGRLLCVRRSVAKSADADNADAETGQDTASGTNNEQYALVARRARDMAVNMCICDIHSCELLCSIRDKSMLFVQVWLAIGWLFLVFTILCRTTFRSFACQDIGGSPVLTEHSDPSICKVVCSPFCLSSDEGESYHRSDYNIDCNSDAYEAYAVVAVAFIFIYPVGVPVCFGALLFWNRHVLGGSLSGGQDADKWWYGDGETLHFLVDGYRVDTFWFEEIEFLR
jgi:hypothetical protein